MRTPGSFRWLATHSVETRTSGWTYPRLSISLTLVSFRGGPTVGVQIIVSSYLIIPDRPVQAPGAGRSPGDPAELSLPPGQARRNSPPAPRKGAPAPPADRPGS